MNNLHFFLFVYLSGLFLYVRRIPSICVNPWLYAHDYLMHKPDLLKAFFRVLSIWIGYTDFDLAII